MSLPWKPPLERGAQGRIVRETGRAVLQPAIERGFHGGDIGRQLGVEVGWIADEIPGMDLEEPREQLARFVGEVGSRAAFNQRQVGLADVLAQLGTDGAHEFSLRELSPQTAKVTFEVPQLAKLLGKSHFNP